ncbi:hypothetical protein PHYC_03967 [Phycisphaerales bacterium]|nr:hypothetical protein PHYC_03967 [Phycisphaerales bacterium]
MARMVYEVKVSDKRTGKASTIDVEAESPAEAGRIAAD